MLTSSNQYLRPEYLTPLPTTLDAKKSPLALLAQTCSQIGTECTNSKLLQSQEKPVNKSNKNDITGNSQTSIVTETIHKINLKNDHSEKFETPEERPDSSCPNREQTPTEQNIRSPRNSPICSERKVEGKKQEMVLEKNSERISPHNSSLDITKPAFTSNILTSSSDPAIKDMPLGTFKPGVSSSSASPFVTGFSVGYPLSMDIMPTSLMSHSTLKSGNINPYFGYGRMKTQDSVVSVCRDPYCTGCGVSNHLTGVTSTTKTCQSGCVQCDHGKSTTSGGFIGHTSAAAYVHSQITASHLPYVCNWISSDTSYCGKRFSSSEELLTHLRTHTSGNIIELTHTMGSSGYSPSHSLLHRTYPTPPLSPLATTRYHPYSKPSVLHLSSSPLSGFTLNHTSLSPYLSPYLYIPRLGTTPGMHL
ncbi:hypothetical protein NQ317_014530 [Molorchus minor]|uniref:C2H2-type domain-containing protein n=1 Tax=Molorchus minor TaxID=1323400 RepID=A0ABQ9JAF0_9CUCU|nr:hypothetical protein NQ317_014530 [Molorchus minor]